MVKRINISFPDDLHERLQPFRETINISRICQDAIEDVIRKKEAFKKSLGELPELEDIIERLREEKKYSRHKVYEFGKTVGIGWAKQADYETLVDTVLAESKYEYTDKEKCTKENMLELFGGETGVSEIIERLQGDLPDLVITPANRAEVLAVFVEGYYKGVTDFWHAIEDLI